MKRKPLVVLTGPTAVGKTKASIGEYGAPWYVPGYGKYKSNNMGITYSLIYKLPL